MRQVMKRGLTTALASMIALAAIGCSDAPMASDAGTPDLQFAKGGGGKGKPPGPFPAVAVLTDDASLYNIRSDAEVRLDLDQYMGPQYDDGVCGLTTTVGNGEDAKVFTHLDYKKGKEGKTCGDMRGFTFDWDDPFVGECPRDSDGDCEVTTLGSMMSIDSVQFIPVGTPVLRPSQFNVGRCNRLIFNPDNRYDPGNGSDSVWVTRESETVWTMETQPYPNDKAWCGTDGRLWHMPFSVTFTLK